MTQANESINSHIEQYLDYYCSLSHAPEFAVLLKGEWGAGKTWFISKYRKRLQENIKLKGNIQKCFYVSLYGMTDFAEIENAFFLQQLPPALSSKFVLFGGNLIAQALKLSLKVDFNKDNKEDALLNISAPSNSLFNFLTNLDKSLLIFDDLERCNIDISNLLGYINKFVEHQGLKIIIVANEDKLLGERDNNREAKKIETEKYKVIKEKLIGKTFSVSLDFEGALENFITAVNSSEVRSFLSDNTALIQELYQKAQHENLRNLRQIVLDFERIFSVLPDKAKNELEILKDILKLLMAFSIEIKRGKMLPKDISKLREKYKLRLEQQAQRNVKAMLPADRNQTFSIDTKENNQEQTSLENIDKMLGKNFEFELPYLFPSELWWQEFFDKGVLDTEKLEQSLPNSKYFQDENTPSWRRLWHYTDLSDDDFEDLLKKIEFEFNHRLFRELGEIKQVFGLLLMFSEAKLYCKSKPDILKDYKLYIDYLRHNAQSVLMASSITQYIDNYDNLGFQGTKIQEFKDFNSYINKIQQLVKLESLPREGQDLLVTMENEIWIFYKMICINNSPNWDENNQKYSKIPIFKYIKQTSFIEKLLSMDHENQRVVFWALKERYAFDDINIKLLEELEWLKSIRILLQNEIARKTGKLSGYNLKLLTTEYLDQVINKLSSAESKTANTEVE